MYQPESRAAYEAANLTRINLRVLEHLGRCGELGSTCDEAIVALGGDHQSISPAFTHLADDGVIMRTEVRRLTRSGRSAAVYCLTTEPSLFAAMPRKTRNDHLMAIFRGAIVARKSGDWADFDKATAEFAASATRQTR